MSKQPLLDHQRIDAILARVEASSTGPWSASIEGVDHTSGSSLILTAEGGMELDGASDGDIEFMANARQDVLYLIAELHRLAAILDTR